jgi:hypothetical protein
MNAEIFASQRHAVSALSVVVIVVLALATFGVIMAIGLVKGGRGRRH